MIIEDGGGKGYAAKVTKEGGLLSFVVIEDEIEWISHENKQAWILHSGNITSAMTEKALLSLTYNGSDTHFHIRDIIVASSNVGWFNVKLGGSLGGGTSATNFNLNVGSGVTNSNIVVMSGSAAMTYTGGSVIKSYYGSNIFHFYSALIIGFGKDICITHTGLDTSTTTNVSIIGYVENLEHI